jgi:hypothetical protein
MQNWLPPEPTKSLQMPDMPGESNEKSNKKVNASPGNLAASTKAFTLPSEAQSDLKKALEVSL